MSNLMAALEYMEMDMAVFPLVENGKRPATARGFKDATTDIDMARLWWGGRPEANIGFAIPDGVLVLDWDLPEAHSLKLEHPTLGRGPDMQVKTRRGWHWYYEVPQLEEGYRWRSKFASVCDIKAPGKGYTVLPPSVVADVAYRWVHPDTIDVLTPFPVELLPMLVREEVPAPEMVGPLAVAKFFPWEQGTAYGLGALRNQLRAVREAENGERNNALYKAAVTIAGYVAGGELGDHALYELRMAALEAGLDEPEVYATMQSGYTTGLRYPKEKP